VTVVDGRVMHNAMSSLPNSLAVYSSLIRIEAQVGILPVAVALPSLERRLEGIAVLHLARKIIVGVRDGASTWLLITNANFLIASR
jgi:hypothetical protein